MRNRLASLRYRLPRMVGALALLLLTLRPAQSQTSNVVGWGSNGVAQLGIGTEGGGSSTPVFTLTAEPIQAIAAGLAHTVTLKSDGTVWAWGYNDNGQIGDGTLDDRTRPVQVKGLSGTGGLTDVKAIAAGYRHTVAVKSDGTVWGWGWNGYNQLGDGTYSNRLTPVQVLGPGGMGVLTGVQAVAAGDYHTVALKQDGTVWAWGNNGRGELGDGTTTNRSAPVQAVGPSGTGVLSGIVAIAVRGDFTVALKQDGTVWTWGDNFEGQLGDGTRNSRSTPAQVLGPNGTGFLTGVKAIAAGYRHTAALKQDGTVWAWGGNGSGQLGIGTIGDIYTPVQVLGPNGTGFLTGVQAIASGNSHLVALKQDGTVWTWGDNTVGELGDGTTTSRFTPVQVKGTNGTSVLNDVRAIAAGSNHTVALLAVYTTVSGTVTLQDCVNQKQPVTFVFRSQDGFAPLIRTPTLNTYGGFSFSDIPSGRYSVAIKGALWLQAVVGLDTTGSSSTVIGATLLAGDGNNDNVVDIADFGLLVNAYNGQQSVAGSGYDARADFNCDGIIDIADFGLLVNNYNIAGDP